MGSRVRNLCGELTACRRWLQRTLESSRADLKFVFIHHLVGGEDKNARGGVEVAPFFEWGGRGLDNSEQFAAKRPGWELPIHQLLVKHRVSAVFHGHDHFYARQELDGIVYQEVPQPGWVGGERVSEATNYGYLSGQIMPSSGHLRVQVGPNGATVSYVRSHLTGDKAGRTNGTVGQTYNISPSGIPRCERSSQSRRVSPATRGDGQIARANSRHSSLVRKLRILSTMGSQMIKEPSC